jgi:hypothetical protein
MLIDSTAKVPCRYRRRRAGRIAVIQQSITASGNAGDFIIHDQEADMYGKLSL